MKSFRLLWVGQLASIFGSGLTTFALAIWAWEQTGLATSLALIPAFLWVPLIIVSPIAGVMVDRWNRKAVLIWADLGTALATFALLMLYGTGSLQIWHIYAVTAVQGALNAFQFPAFSASVTLLVDKKDYSRASGMRSLASSSSHMLAPIAAAALIGFIGVDGILVIDLLSFGVAMLTLALTPIPQPTLSAEQLKKFSLFKDINFGFRYIWTRSSLLGLQLVILASNFIKTFGTAVLIPMILARTGGDELALSYVQSAAALGLVVGGAVLSIWKGPHRHIHGVLSSIILTGLFLQIFFGLGVGLAWWIFFGFLGSVFRPWTISALSAIWQSKVEPEYQGRIFATRRVLAQITIPLAYILAGPLADKVFEPALMAGGSLVSTFGGLVGTGPGAGMSLMIVLAGAGSVLIGLWGYALREVRDVEEIIPDFDVQPIATAAD